MGATDETTGQAVVAFVILRGDAANNGLTYLVNKFKDHKLGGHLTLIKGERSELAELAANIL